MAKSFTYGGDPSKNARDAVRFLIGDTIEAFPMFSDGEINYQITQTPNQKLAGAELLEIKARQFARLADEKVGDVSKAFSKVAANMKACAKDLRDDALNGALPFFGGLTKSGKLDLSQQIDDVQPAFSIGQSDNPDAVQLNQDYEILSGLVGHVL